MLSRGTNVLVRAGRAALAVAAVLGGLAVGVRGGAARAVSASGVPDLIDLNAVGCTRDGGCLAVGQDVTSGKSYAESWNGAGWRVLPAVVTGGSTTALWDVACPPGGSCIAVGSYADASGLGRTLAASWDGARWRVLPAVTLGLFDGLSGVACPGPRQCVAVGATLVTSFRTLAEAWDGTRWRVLATPTPGGRGALNAVACPLPARCIAVGSTGYGGVRRPLALAWDGRRWRALTRPQAPGGYGNLVSIGCDGPRRCVAGGYAGTAGAAAGQPLVETWNGTAWQLVPLPAG